MRRTLQEGTKLPVLSAESVSLLKCSCSELQMAWVGMGPDEVIIVRMRACAGRGGAFPAL